MNDNKGGRKPSKLKKFIKANGISHADLSNLIKNVIFNNNQSELEDLLTDTTKPMVIRLFIRAYLQDFKSGSLQNTSTMFSRAFGAPKQTIETEGSLDIKNLPPDEREQKIDDLIKKYEESKNE